MNKAELIERIIDAITDPWNECPFDFEDLAPLNLEEATGYLADLRHDEDLSDLDPEDRLPAAVTPELYMEAFNCYLRKMKHECHILRLSKYISDNCMVCEYANFYGPDENTPDVFPVDFLCGHSNINELPIGNDIDLLDFVRICQHSSEFNASEEYCYYDEKHDSLVSTDNPFTDGIYSARAFAEFILGLDGREALTYFINDLLDDVDIRWIFHCSEAEVRELYSLS